MQEYNLYIQNLLPEAQRSRLRHRLVNGVESLLRCRSRATHAQPQPNIDSMQAASGLVGVMSYVDSGQARQARTGRSRCSRSPGRCAWRARAAAPSACAQTAGASAYSAAASRSPLCSRPAPQPEPHGKRFMMAESPANQPKLANAGAASGPTVTWLFHERSKRQQNITKRQSGRVDEP